MKNVKKNNLFLIVLFAAIVLGCKNSQKDAAQTNTMPEAIPEVDTMSLKTQYFQKQITYYLHNLIFSLYPVIILTFKKSFLLKVSSLLLSLFAASEIL